MLQPCSHRCKLHRSQRMLLPGRSRLPWHEAVGNATCNTLAALQISKRMMVICGKEGLHVNDATMKALVESSNGDLRLILGQLQVSGHAAAVATASDCCCLCRDAC